MNNHLPTISDIESILAEKPEIRAQVSRKGVINSALPDQLRLKTEAIALRRQLVENKASLDAYASRREQSKQQIAHAEKTLAALRSLKTSPPPVMTTTASPPSVLDQFESLTGPKASHYYAENRKAITAEFASRQRDDRQLEKEMHAARQSAKQQAQVKKYNR